MDCGVRCTWTGCTWTMERGVHGLWSEVYMDYGVRCTWTVERGVHGL